MAMKKGVQYTFTKVGETQAHKKDNKKQREEKLMYHDNVPSNGITKATLYDTANDVVNIVNKHRIPLMVVDPARYALKPQYSATTSCLITDEFDEAKGMDIAKRKTLRKYNADKIAALSRMIADLKVLINALERQLKIASERVARDEAFLEEEHSGKA